MEEDFLFSCVSCSRSSFSISFKTDLVELSIFLSVKLLISSSNLNEFLTG